MDRDTLWHHTHQERLALADTLRTLTPEQWEHPSLCEGWTVKDVAAHIITGHPQTGVGTMVGLLARNIGRGYNTMIYRETKRVSARMTPDDVLADFERFATSRCKALTTTTVEPLVDAIVHHQDIIRPLGLRHDPDPEAAAVAADRLRLLRWLMGTRKTLRDVRMVATDVDWDRGRGAVVQGPMRELLMLCAGREAIDLVRT